MMPPASEPKRMTRDSSRWGVLGLSKMSLTKDVNVMMGRFSCANSGMVCWISMQLSIQSHTIWTAARFMSVSPSGSASHLAACESHPGGKGLRPSFLLWRRKFCSHFLMILSTLRLRHEEGWMIIEAGEEVWGSLNSRSPHMRMSESDTLSSCIATRNCEGNATGSDERLQSIWHSVLPGAGC